MMTVLIFANGEIEDVAWIRPYLATATAIMAANGGSRHLYALQHPPDVVIGDMDSLPGEIRAWLEAAGTHFVTHPTAKNETDLELALLFAVDAYPDDLLLFGLLGGRLDQTLANILLLTHPALKGHPIQALTAFERAWLVTAETEFRGQVGDLVSLIPVGGDAVILKTSGLKWPLDHEVLALGPARGISNVMTAEKATVSVSKGYVLCIHTTGKRREKHG
jgi:thiamine pyrophosphokinase